MFPACGACNGGTSDDDAMVAFLAHLDPKSPEQFTYGTGLMKTVNRQFPGALPRMFIKTPIQARAEARRLGLKPAPGQTFAEMGIVKIPTETHQSVATVARKLAKAIYYMKTGNIFPADGGIMFQWFTNAQMREHGKIVYLEALEPINGVASPIVRNKQNLSDQFDYLYSVDKPETLHVLRVVFGKVFGFVLLMSQRPGQLEAMNQRIRKVTGRKNSPFRFLSSNSPELLNDHL